LGNRNFGFIWDLVLGIWNLSFEGRTMMLFTPLRIGPLQLKNRIAMAPMATHYADETGAVTERLKNYYLERARGGAGLIILESGYIHPLGRGGIRRMGLHEDRLIPGLRGLVDAVHAEGAKISSLLHHAGRQINVKNTRGQYPVSASSLPSGMEAVVPRTLKVQEIEELVEGFGQAARRSLAAGFDAILIHAAHGYLIHQFLSPLSNIRRDRYGGTFTRRLRFLQEIVLRCQESIGKDFPLMVRISASEFIPGGITLKDGKKIARRLEEWGVKAIHVSGGTHDTVEMEIPPMAIPRGCLVHLAEGIKEAVSIPVGAVGKIVEPKMAEEILQQGKSDLIAMGRALLADPEFPRKAREGRFQDIRPCIGCLQGCRDYLYQGLPITCLVNAQAGREMEFRISPAENRKKVFIIGGGPGGMEAARVAALRGHEVTLAEKENHLGGQFRLASLPGGKREIRGYLDYLSGQLKKLGIKIRLNQEVTPEDLKGIKADAVILAAGGIPLLPPIPGFDRENVITAWQALAHPEKAGKKVVIIGGGSVGAETAEFLLDHKKDVTLVEMLPEIAGDAEKVNRKVLLRSLGEKGVKIRVLTQATAILAEGVEVEFDGNKETLPADTVVLATGIRPNNDLEAALRPLPAKLHKVGDCTKPRKAIDAIHEGFQAAVKL
jgi:2,4-dienoyl-CoA reductase-like NADH-dependent reductase (Old Yellow Enzyme family)/thioredoxin reductase